jgi:hypothetical protein
MFGINIWYIFFFQFFFINLLCQRAANFLCMRSSLLESVIVTGFQTKKAYSSLGVTGATYSISTLSTVEKENRHDDENEVFYQYAHLNP